MPNEGTSLPSWPMIRSQRCRQLQKVLSQAQAQAPRPASPPCPVRRRCVASRMILQVSRCKAWIRPICSVAIEAVQGLHPEIQVMRAGWNPDLQSSGPAEHPDPTRAPGCGQALTVRTPSHRTAPGATARGVRSRILTIGAGDSDGFGMARPLRIELAGGRSHVANRGNEPKNLFRNEGDRSGCGVMAGERGGAIAVGRCGEDGGGEG